MSDMVNTAPGWCCLILAVKTAPDPSLVMTSPRQRSSNELIETDGSLSEHFDSTGNISYNANIACCLTAVLIRYVWAGPAALGFVHEFYTSWKLLFFCIFSQVVFVTFVSICAVDCSERLAAGS